MDRPITTLFLLMSVDGKISTGSTDELDVDTDFPTIPGLQKGLQQYYDIELTTDLWSLVSGKVQAKLGVNEKEFPNERRAVSFVIIDSQNLTEHGVEYFSHLAKNVVLVTSNKSHPGYSVEADNLSILYYDTLNPERLLKDLYDKFNCQRITVQTGGTLNGLFLRAKVLDYVDIVVAPVLIGGKDTPSLIDGNSLIKKEELHKLGILRLDNAQVLEDSYLRLSYKVIS